VFANEPADLLGIDDDAAMTQLGSNPAVPLSLELIADCSHSRDDLGVMDIALRTGRGEDPYRIGAALRPG